MDLQHGSENPSAYASKQSKAKSVKRNKHEKKDVDGTRYANRIMLLTTGKVTTKYMKISVTT